MTKKKRKERRTNHQASKQKKRRKPVGVAGRHSERGAKKTQQMIFTLSNTQSRQEVWATPTKILVVPSKGSLTSIFLPEIGKIPRLHN